MRLRFALTGHAFLNVPDHTHTVQEEDGGWVGVDEFKSPHDRKLVRCPHALPREGRERQTVCSGLAEISYVFTLHSLKTHLIFDRRGGKAQGVASTTDQLH